MGRLTDEQLTDLVIAAGVTGERGRYLAVEAVHELRERRAQDLSDEEREALSFARDVMAERASSGRRNERSEAALAVLDKLLERK